MRAPDPPAGVVLLLRMAPVSAFIDEVRHFVESFCTGAGVPKEREGQLALATHELVQNAIDSGRSPGIELRLAVDRARGRVEVAVTNQCGAGQPEALRERLRRLEREEPLAGYLRAMAADPRAPGGLGLARIRYEAQLALELEVAGDQLTVKASGELRPPPLRSTQGVGHG